MEKNCSQQNNCRKVRLILGITLIATFLVGIIVCSIVDVAINKAFTWALYPISSIVFALCLIFPIVLFDKRGILPSLCMLSVLVMPYLLVLDWLIGTDGLVLKVGGVISAIVLVYLWVVLLIMKLCRNRKWIGGGISTILAAPVCVLINYSLSLTLTPAAASFDMWDILDIVILVAVGLGLICVDLILKKLKKS